MTIALDRCSYKNSTLGITHFNPYSFNTFNSLNVNIAKYYLPDWYPTKKYLIKGEFLLRVTKISNFQCIFFWKGKYNQFLKLRPKNTPSCFRKCGSEQKSIPGVTGNCNSRELRLQSPNSLGIFAFGSIITLVN